MDENFKKIKKKFLIYSLIKSLICGASAGLFAVGVILLALKLAGISIHGGYYALIGVGVAGVCFGIVFPLLRPDDLTVARKLDNEYGLRERVETMVAYENDSSDIAQLQREDAQTKLGSLPKRKPNFKKIWQYVLIPVLSVATFGTALGLHGPDGRNPEVNYAVTEWQLSAVREIIGNVQDSELNEEAKQGTVTALEGFYNSLVVGVSEATFDILFLSTVRLIDGVITADNTYFDICSQLVTSEEHEGLAFMLYDSVLAYRGLIKVNSYDGVKSRSATLYEDIDYLCGAYLVNDDDSLLNCFKAYTQDDGLMYYLNQYKDGLEELLQKSGVDGSDGTYKALSEFVNEIAEVTTRAGQTDDYIHNTLLRGTFKSLAESLPFFSYLQSYNYLMDEFVRERLALVFGFPSDNLPQVIPELKKPAEPEAPPEEDDPNEGGGSGGRGNGDMLYGSDDIIYDPDKGYVSYGEVINEYYSRLLSQIIDGSIPEDIASILTNYFDMLMSGIEQNGDENN